MEYNMVSDDAPEGMSVLEIASAGQRFGAWSVDTVIGMLVVFVGVVLGWGLGVEIIFALVLLVYAVVYLWMVAATGQSPGKMAVKIRIVKTDGTHLGFGGMLLREIIGKFVSSLIIYLGYIWILFDGQRQGWHDKIAGTYVVKV